MPVERSQAVKRWTPKGRIMSEQVHSTTRQNLLAVLVLLARLVVGAIFLYASFDKIAHPDQFAQAIYNYRLVPLSLLHPMALLLPWLEAVTGVALILGVARRGAALFASMMSLAFIIGLSSALARDLDISCGCFSTDGGHAVGQDLLIRDIFLLSACLWILLAQRCGWSLCSLWRR